MGDSAASRKLTVFADKEANIASRTVCVNKRGPACCLRSGTPIIAHCRAEQQPALFQCSNFGNQRLFLALLPRSDAAALDLTEALGKSQTDSARRYVDIGVRRDVAHTTIDQCSIIRQVVDICSDRPRVELGAGS